ncbi:MULTISPECIES: hypothetical protein [Rhodovulum]|uniref:Uncharacterized protein n=2 Tax=Rhodovulum TaxID=34008 RepID=A0A8E2VK40_9RHOB|nr:MULTISPECIES: hypothetical protein [Rhodovulum]PTW50185.1 hypothetical protein C8N38_105143 [Rhodovulum kholense]RAP42493.1 hypothetical protein BYZ73_04700 [Rhodovulum viride]
MTPDEVTALFTRSDGDYLFARWGRPIAPVVFGVDDATLATFKGACEAVVSLAGHQLTETDPDLGSNLIVFFFEDWLELVRVPHLDRLVPDLVRRVGRLQAAGANQYRFFRFDEDGAIRAAFVFVRMDADLARVPAESIALNQMVQTILLWSDTAFAERSPLARTPDGTLVLRPEIAAVIRAGYDPAMPTVARDSSHALRLAARIGRTLGQTLAQDT